MNCSADYKINHKIDYLHWLGVFLMYKKTNIEIREDIKEMVCQI